MRRGLGTVLLAAALLLPGGAVAQRPPLPSPGLSPSGANEAGCRSQRPPVILVHGTRADMTLNWQGLAPALKAAGWCVFALDLPDRGQAPMAESAAVLASFAQRVRESTGARRVSIVGHSQGGLIARRLAKDTRGRRLDDVIAMGTPQLGYYTEPPGDVIDSAFNTECPACYEMAQGSSFMTALNAGDPTPGKVSWTQIVTLHDQVATPVPNQYLEEGRLVENITLQDRCPDHVVEHLLLAYDPLVYQWVQHALTRRGPADPAAPITC